MKIKQDGITYTLSTKTLTAIVSGCDEKKEGKVVLPAQVEHKGKTYAVTEIGDWAFHGCSHIQSIIISDGVQSIGDSAFRECCWLTDVVISKSVTQIGKCAFLCSYFNDSDVDSDMDSDADSDVPQYVYSHLTSIVVENGNPVYDSRDNCNAIIETATNTLVVGCSKTIIPNGIQSIAAGAFWCTDIVSVDVPESIKEICHGAFFQCANLSSVTLHNGTTSINDRAFYGCTSLKSIFIPKSIQEIGNGAFCGCSLETIVVDSSNPVYDSRDNCNALIETATNTLIAGSANTKIPSSVTQIGRCAFIGCTSLTHIDIPETVTTIGGDAFRDCEKMVSITFAEGLIEMGEWVFDGCKSLKELVFPNSLKELGINYFYGCDSLKTLVVPNSVVSTECIGMESLLQLPQLTYLQLPPHILIDLCTTAGMYHYDIEEDKATGIKITTENDVMCFSVPMPALCQHLKLNPNCKISVGEKSTIRLRDIFKGTEKTQTSKGDLYDDIPYFPEEAEYDM